MPEFLEGSAYWYDLLAIVKSGTDFGFSGGRHQVVKDLGDGMYRAHSDECSAQDRKSVV